MRIPFEFRHLEYFVAVAEELNFRRAAARLHISQPPLSRAIRELETSVGVRLFERSTTNVKLTSRGAEFLEHARRLLGDGHALVRAMKEKQAPGGPLRVGMTVAIPEPRRARLAAEWAREFAPVRVEIEAGESRHLLPRLRRQKFDFALLGFPADLSGFESETVHTVPLVVMLPSSHTAARRRVVSLHELADLPLFWFKRPFNPPYFDHCARVFDTVRPPLAFIYVPPGQLSTLDRIRQGEGFALLTPEQARMEVKGVRSRSLAEGEALGFSMVAVWKGDPAQAQQGALAKRFAAVARKVLADRRAEP